MFHGVKCCILDLTVTLASEGCASVRCHLPPGYSALNVSGHLVSLAINDTK